MWNVITLDGYFEGEKAWELSFHEIVWGSELERFCLEQLNSTAHLVFGRKTRVWLHIGKPLKGKIRRLLIL